MAAERRRAAVLWLVAALLSGIAAGLSAAKGTLKWLLVLASAAMAAMALTTWRRSRS